jgi:chloramphenicol-sensitive protein RarD
LYKGVLLSISASVLFAVLYFYTTLLFPLNGEEVFGWRVLLTFPFVTILMQYFGDWSLAKKIGSQILRKPALLATLLSTSALLGVQIWLFMWAPLHGRALQVSLGYFLLPLTMVLAGRLFYRERLTGMQKLAVACAVAGVANEICNVGNLSWETMLVAIGYPAYFILRRKHSMGHFTGLWFEMGFMLPAACWFIMNSPHSLDIFPAHPRLYLLVPVLGLVSASALACYILASRYLTLAVFGLLGYVEPVLLVCVGLAIGETIKSAQWLTYIPIWTALSLLLFHGIGHALSRKPTLA